MQKIRNCVDNVFLQAWWLSRNSSVPISSRY